MKRILVVDNNPVILEFMQMVLTEAGYQVRTAESGLAAIGLIDDYQPELIFVDLVMPELDGRLLCRILRARTATQQSRIVVLSGIAVEDTQADLPLEIDAYIAKMPFGDLRSLVLKVAADLAAGRTKPYRGVVVGKEKLYSREITAELLYSRQHLETFLQSTPIGVLELTRDGTVLMSNQPACVIVGAPTLELVSRRLEDFLDGAAATAVAETLRQLDRETLKIGQEGDVSIGKRRVMLSFVPMKFNSRRSILVLLQDITDWYDSNHRIKILLQEKELLLREVHHRVKNNLMTISSLLSLQADAAAAPQVSSALQEADSRVQSMLQIYELLFQSDTYTEIDLGTFLRTLIGILAATYPETILTPQIPPEAVPVGTNAAISLGLAVNELVTNACKHAFPRDTRGTVEVALTRDADGTFRVTVSDNGVGLPHSLDTGATVGLGLQMVQGTVDQLKGSLRIDRDNGTTFTISFTADQ